MAIGPGVLTLLVVLNLGLTLALCAGLVLLAARVRDQRRSEQEPTSSRPAHVRSEDTRQDEGLPETGASELGPLRGELDALHSASAELREDLRHTAASVVSRVAVVRYDAFDDMAGALSFSAAILDERGHGLIVSAINGRSESRCYAKPVTDGTSEHRLTAEETDAIRTALDGQGTVGSHGNGRGPATAPAGQGGRRRRAS